MIKFNKNDFNTLIKNGNILVDFYTENCGSCRLIKKELMKIDDKINIIEVDALENRNIAKKYGIMSVPTLIYFNEKGNYEIKKGYMLGDDILQWILNR